jgi:hypothetical protein
VNRLLSVSGLAHGCSGVELRKSGNAGDPNLLEAIGSGSSWTLGTPGQQLEALRLSHSTTWPIPTWHGNDDCIWGYQLEDALPRRSIGVSPSPKNSLSMMMGSRIQGATSSRPLPRIQIGCGPGGPGMFRAVMTDPGRMRCGCGPGGVEPYPFDRGLLIEDAGTEREWRYEGRGPFCIRSDPSGSSQNLCSTNERTKRETSLKSETLFFYCLLYQDTWRLFSWILSASIYLSIEFE